MSKLPGHALIVDFHAQSPEKAKRLLELLDPVIKQSYSESITPTYHWSVPVTGDGTVVHGLELYEDRAAMGVHMTGEAFKVLIPTITKEDILTEPPILENAKPVAGFLVRPNAPNHGNYPGAFIWTGKFVTEKGKADEAIEALKENLPYIESSEPETISFLILKGLDEEDVVYVWERYTSESALRDIHHKSAGYLRLREKTTPLYKSRSIDGYTEVAGFLTKEGGLL